MISKRYQKLSMHADVIRLWWNPMAKISDFLGCETQGPIAPALTQ
jgi:hypothetical protein